MRLEADRVVIGALRGEAFLCEVDVLVHTPWPPCPRRRVLTPWPPLPSGEGERMAAIVPPRRIPERGQGVRTEGEAARFVC